MPFGCCMLSDLKIGCKNNCPLTSPRERSELTPLTSLTSNKLKDAKLKNDNDNDNDNENLQFSIFNLQFSIFNL